VARREVGFGMLGGMGQVEEDREEELFLRLEGLTLARAIVRMLEATDVPELVKARQFAVRAAIRLDVVDEGGLELGREP
jgi:hypothetical protein